MADTPVNSFGEQVAVELKVAGPSQVHVLDGAGRFCFALEGPFVPRMVLHYASLRRVNESKAREYVRGLADGVMHMSLSTVETVDKRSEVPEQPAPLVGNA